MIPEAIQGSLVRTNSLVLGLLCIFFEALTVETNGPPLGKIDFSSLPMAVKTPA